MSKTRFSFEKAMERAERIAQAIEQGEIGLEDSIKQFEEGMGLIKKCRRVLDEAELRIRQIEAEGAEDVTEPPTDE